MNKKLLHTLLVGSCLAATAVAPASASDLKYLVGLDVGYGSAQFDEGSTDNTAFPAVYIGISKQISNRFYVGLNTGLEFAAFTPNRDVIGGNMLRSNLSLSTSYRLPITVMPKVRFFLSGVLQGSYGSYSTLYETRWSYLWESYDDVQRFELSAGGRLHAEYRPSMDFGALFGGGCDIGFGDVFKSCRLGLGYKF